MTNKYRTDPEFRAKSIEHAKLWPKINPEGRRAIEQRRYHKEMALNPVPKRARAAVNYRVRTGQLKRASDLICACGKRASHYHHYNGYEPENYLKVVAVCRECHTEVHHLVRAS